MTAHSTSRSTRCAFHATKANGRAVPRPGGPPVPRCRDRPRGTQPRHGTPTFLLRSIEEGTRSSVRSRPPFRSIGKLRPKFSSHIQKINETVSITRPTRGSKGCPHMWRLGRNPVLDQAGEKQAGFEEGHVRTLRGLPDLKVSTTDHLLRPYY